MKILSNLRIDKITMSFYKNKERDCPLLKRIIFNISRYMHVQCANPTIGFKLEVKEVEE